ncbi:MAG: universal stress protein [Alphaproteobacteria bacterium]|nr:universal stress protein [Alphaproteobacteria bacterium]
MSSAVDGYRRILFPTDLKSGTELAYVHAFRLALADAGTLHVVHVHEPSLRPDWTHLPSARELCVRWGRLDADQGVEAYSRLGVHVQFSALPSLELEDPIEDTMEREQPDLLVLATDARQGAARLAVPSVAEDIARHGSMPALFVPRDARPFVDAASGSTSLRTIVIPAGTEHQARLALAHAIRLVSSYDAAPTDFVLVHVGTRESLPKVSLPDDTRWSLRVDVRNGNLPEQIVHAAEAHDADCIVMATYGHDSLLDWIRGSRTELVVRSAPCPVLAVPEA